MDHQHVKPRPHANAADLETTLKELRRYYETGRKLHAKLEPSPVFRQLKAQAPHLSDAMKLYYAKALADPQRGYTPREFNQLCALCRQHQFALGTAALTRLIAVPKKHRPAFQLKAIKGHWTNQRLIMAIRQRFGRRRPNAGNRVRPPQDTGEALYRLSRICHAWNGLHESLTREPAQSNVKLTPTLKRHLEEAHGAMQDLWQVVDERLDST